MYSVFLPFGAVVIDLFLVFMYFKHDFWLLGGATAIFALFPLLVTTFLLYSKWTRLKLATIFIGFLQSGCQLLLQTTLLIRFWDNFNGVLIQYGTLLSPQYSIILVSCIFSSLVVAKSARECHFLSQDPDRQLHVRLSHFRATPFFLLHTSYRAVSLGLVAAFLPVWAWILIIASLLLTNFVLTVKIFALPKLYSGMTAMTAILTPSLYPTETATHISILAKFHILNSISVSGVIVIAAIISNTFTMDSLVWGATEPLISLTSAADNATLAAASRNTTAALAAAARTPVLLTYGVLPPVIVASILYIFIIVIIMGILRPGFLELPPSQYSSRRNTNTSIKKIHSTVIEEERQPVLEEEEKLQNGLVYSDIQDITSEKNTLVNNSDKKQSNDTNPDVKYLDLLEGKETDL